MLDKKNGKKWQDATKLEINSPHVYGIFVDIGHDCEVLEAEGINQYQL